MEAKTIDFRTPAKIKRDNLYAKIASRYKVLREMADNQAGSHVTDNAIFNIIAVENDMTHVTVRKICISAGVTAPKTTKS